MTKRHYNMIAEILKTGVESQLDGKAFLPSTIVDRLARAFAADNSSFNEFKFMKACGITPQL